MHRIQAVGNWVEMVNRKVERDKCNQTIQKKYEILIFDIIVLFVPICVMCPRQLPYYYYIFP